MTDKELKRLGRAELIDIMFELQRRCDEYDAEIDALKKELEEKEIRISKAGSIAEAALQVTGVFEAAQAAANQYLASIHAASRNTEAYIAQAEQQKVSILANATEQANGIVAAAERKAQQIEKEARERAQNEWAQFRQNADELTRAHEELSMLMKKDL